MANPTVIVDFLADTTGLSKGLKDAQRSSQGFGSSLKGLAKTGAIAAGAAGVGALVYTLKTGFSEFQQAQKVSAQTAATLKSTGGAANVTAKHITDLAGSLMKLSGQDDEAIQSGENLLLTFTNVQNRVGKGNKIFDEATKTMLDMSTALGQDMSSSAIQLGKALNDPIKGITALQRVGVSFTQAQKDQIKTLVEHGKTVEAQKVILAELNKEFGGSAEAAGKTLPGQLNILRESFNNLAGDLVAKLVPALEATIQFLRDHWPEISKVIRDAWEQDIKPVLEAFGQLVAAEAKLIRDNWGTIGPIVQAVADQIKTAAKIITDVLQLLAALLRGDWSRAWQVFKQTISDVIDAIVAGVKLRLLPLELTLKALWAGITATTTAAWTAVKNAAETAVDAIRTAFNGMITFLTNLGARVQSAIATVRNWLAKPGEWAQDAVTAAKEAFNGFIGYLEGLAGRVGKVMSGVANAFKAPLNAVIGAWNNLGIPGFTITIPIPHAPDIHFGWGGASLPDIPLLAQGGVVSRPTLAMVGEGQGREIVAPEALLRQILAEQRPEIRVFIGDTELKGIVRAEVVSENNRTAQVLLAGLT